jgi:hypothetical protein
MNPIASNTQSILDAARAAQEVDPSRMAANLQALDARIATGDLGPELGPETVPPAASGGGAALTGAKVVGGLLIVGAVALVMRPGSGEGPDSARSAAPVVATSPAALEAPPELVPEAKLTPLNEPEPETKAKAKAKSKSKSKSKSKVSESPIDRLEEEMALMGEARRALGRGDARKALSLLNRHARDFPRGEFKRERVVSRVTALCALGQPETARRVAKRYLKSDSTSVHAQRIEQTCAGKDAK